MDVVQGIKGILSSLKTIRGSTVAGATLNRYVCCCPC